MLSENIQVASLITDSLQQKVYNMALEELEAFLGRSVEPPSHPCLSLQTLGPHSTAFLPWGCVPARGGHQIPGPVALSASLVVLSPALDT